MRKMAWIFIILGITLMHAWELLFMFLIAIITPFVCLGFIFWLFNVDTNDLTINDSNDDNFEDGFVCGWLLNQFYNHRY